MEDFVAYPSRWRIAFLLLIAVAFVALGLWIGGAFGPAPESRRYPAAFILPVAWFSVAFFGFCGVVAARKLFDTSEQLRIGPAGIRYSSWSGQTIPWSEIIDMTTWSFKGQQAIILHLANPASFPGRGSTGVLAAANRQLTGGDISISLTGTNRSFNEAIAAIALFRNGGVAPDSL